METNNDMEDLKELGKTLESKIGKRGSSDILDKLSSFFVLSSNPRLLLINKDYVVEWVSSQESSIIGKTIYISPGISTCHLAYRNFKQPCHWCSVREALKSSKHKFMYNVTTPGIKKDPIESPILTSVDLRLIPCGSYDDGTYSHCILEVIGKTSIGERKVYNRQKVHRLKRILFTRLQDPVKAQSLLQILLFGCLYATGPKVTKCSLVVPQEIKSCDDSSQNTKKTTSEYQSYSLTRSKRTEDSFNLLFSDNKIVLSKLVGKVGCRHIFDNSLFSLSEADISFLYEGKVIHFDNCKKAVVYVNNDIEGDIPNFFLIIDKSGLDDFITFDEMATLSAYASYAEQTIINRYWYTNFSNLQNMLRTITRMASRTYKDAYTASLIVSGAHNIKSQWESIETDIDLILGKLNNEQKTDPIIIDLIKNLTTTSESFKQFFQNTRKWRTANTAKYRSFSLHQVLHKSLETFKIRFNEKNIKVNLDSIPDHIKVMGDFNTLKDAIESLLQNSYDALALTNNRYINIKYYEHNDKIRLAIEDNGEGFLKKDKEVIWTPGKTSKTNGTGYGLPFVEYAIESVCKGKVECYSENNITGFVLYLNTATI